MSGEDEGGQGSQGTAPPDSGDQGSQQVAVEPVDDNSLASGFLQRVPEEHRTLLEPYVKQWDAGVTRRFQQLQSQVDPFKDILSEGVDAEQVKNAWNLYQLLDTNPQYLYQLLKTELETGDQGQQQVPPQGAEGDPFQGLPPEVRQQFEQQAKLLEALANHVLSEKEMTEIQQQDAELDAFMGQLHTEYDNPVFGKFDDDYVMAKMARGMDADVAIKEYFAAVQQVVTARDQAGNGPGAQAPPILSGGGAPLMGGTDVKKASSKDVVSLTANLLRQANAQGKN